LTTHDITAQDREIHPGRTLLTALAAVLFALGWIIAQVATAVWFVGAWMFVATREGWRTAKLSHEPARPR